MEDIGDLSVLIGSNSSGKSNVLEALVLFFNEFDPAPQRNLGAVNDYVWFDRNFEEAIEFTVALELSKEELAKIISEQILASLKVEETNVVTLTREISGTPTAASWSTRSIRVNEVPLMEEGQLVYKLEEKKEIMPEAPSSPGPVITPAEILGGLLQNISQTLKGKFRTISAARNVVAAPTRFGDRISFIRQTTLAELTTMGGSLDGLHMRKWSEMEDYVREISPSTRDLRVLTGQITMREEKSDIGFPISLVGGGNQEVVALLHELTKEEDGIYGIEEPEIHLHPQLARQLFEASKNISSEKQIFIATHSTVFVDLMDLVNTWIVKKEDKKTKIIRVKEARDLTKILHDLGIRPSDIFYANGVVFVEGQTEKIVLPMLAKKMGIDFKEFELSVIPTYGKSSGRYHLSVWIDASKSAQIPYFMIFDKGAEKEASRLVKRGLLKHAENLFILKLGSIEDYYPQEKFIEAIESEYGVEISDQEKTDILRIPRAENGEKYLRAKNQDVRGWKVIVGTRVAEQMSPEDIHDDIKRIIERIATQLRTI